MRTLILGTDWHEDCDDVAAVRILSRAHKRGEINFAGIIINSCMQYSVASLAAFLDTEGVNVPIGIDSNAIFSDKVSYQKRLANHSTLTNTDAFDGVKLYRKLLVQSNEPVEIIEIGFLQAVTAALLSQPDEISPLSGIELFNQKVAKMWIMGGRWDEQGNKEFNFCAYPIATKAAHELVKNCPSPITFLGWEIGIDVITALPSKHDDPLRNAMIDYGAQNGRPSWDPLTAVLAIIGNEALAGYDCVCGTATVDSATGRNYFISEQNGKHKYLIKKFDNNYYENILNDLLK